MILSINKVKNNKIDKLINKIIKKPKLTVIAVKNNDISSFSNNRVSKIDKISTKSKNIKNLLKIKNLLRLNICNNLSTQVLKLTMYFL